MLDLLERQAAAGDPTSKSDWAYTPDEVPSHWKLRIDDRSHAIAAAMALGPAGFRGQKVDIPADALAGVKAKVRAALTRFGVPADSPVWQHVKASEAADPMPGMPQPQPAPQAQTISVDSFKAYVTKLWQSIAAFIAEKGQVTKDDLPALQQAARSHAGGKARAAQVQQQRQQQQAAEFADLWGSEDGQGHEFFYTLRKFAQPPEWIPLLPLPGTYKHPKYGDIKITRERNAQFVDHFNRGVYQNPVPVDAEHETELSGALGWIVRLRQNADGSADGQVRWTDRGTSMITADRFAYVSPSWFDTWGDPATGTEYKDILTGAALCTRPFFKPPNLRPLVASEAGTIVVDEDPVALDDLVDLAPDLDPTTATLTGLTSSFGSVVAPVTSPAQTTTRPGSEVPQPTTEGGRAMPENTTQTTQASPASTATDDVARRYTEMEAKIATLEAINVQREAALKAAEERNKASEGRIELMEKAERRKRLTDRVLGRGGTGDGRRWFGEVEENVTMLEEAAEKFGEESDFFKGLVNRLQGEAERLHEAGFYKEKGTGASGGRASEYDRLKAEARTFAETSGNGADPVAQAKAMEVLLERDPSLYRRLIDEETRERRGRGG